MSTNTKIRLTILASVVALAAAAPAAFADSGTWYQGIHTDPPNGSLDTPAASHTEYTMNKKIVPSNVAPNTGTWYQGIHTDPPNGSLDTPASSHTEYIMNKKIVPSNVAPVFEPTLGSSGS